MDVSLSELLGAGPNANDAIQRSLAAYLANQQAQQMAPLQVQAAQQDNAINAFKLQQAQSAAQAQQQAQQAYQDAVSAFVQSPSAQGAADLQMRFPDQSKAIAESWKTRDEAVQNADRKDLAEIYSLLDAGRPDLVQQRLEERQAAEEKAGKQEPMVGTLLNAIKTDPAKAKGIAAYTLASIPGGEDFARTLSAIGKGEGQNHVINEGGALVDNAGNVLYQAGKSAKYEKIRNADGTESIVEIPQSGPAGRSAAPAPASGGMTGAQMEQAALAAVPGATVTSRARTPQHNAEVGGKPNSYHLTDQARDFVPPAGMTIPQMAAQLKAAMPGMKVIAESDHVHVQPMARNQAASAPSGGAKVLYTSKPSQMGEDAATVNFYAQKVAAGGDLPQLGMGKDAAAMRQAILRRAAQIQTGQGMTGGDSNLLHADVKTATAALTQLQRTRNSLDPFLKTFDGNVDQVRQLAPKAVGGSIPVFNRWIQAGRVSIKGDPEVSKFNVVINAVANENAKIMSGASGGAVTSDSARHEAMSLINNAQTYDQLMGVLQQMQTDTRIRLKAMDDRQAELRGKISGKPVQAAAPSPSPAPTKPNPFAGSTAPQGATKAARNPKTGQTVYLVGGRWVDSSGKAIQ